MRSSTRLATMTSYRTVFGPNGFARRIEISLPYITCVADEKRYQPPPSEPPTLTNRAALIGVRLHDLRHTYASFDAGGGLGLPIIGLLLGHAQAATTARYAHLDNDPLRRASEAIGGRIAAALEGNRRVSVVPFCRQAMIARE
jgi:hypothetical protein